jgi:hypothetical protein
MKPLGNWLIPFRFKQENLMGFVLRDLTTVIIPPLYDRVYPFAKSGIALVKKENKYGYIGFDENGIKEITSCSFDYAYTFSGNTALVSINGFWSYINQKGMLLNTKPGISKVGHHNLWRRKRSLLFRIGIHSYFSDDEDSPILPFNSMVTLMNYSPESAKETLINGKRLVIQPERYGMAMIKSEVGLYGFVDVKLINDNGISSVELINPQYLMAENFVGEFAYVKNSEGFEYYITQRGVELLK